MATARVQLCDLKVFGDSAVRPIMWAWPLGLSCGDRRRDPEEQRRSRHCEAAHTGGQHRDPRLQEMGDKVGTR